MPGRQRTVTFDNHHFESIKSGLNPIHKDFGNSPILWGSI